MDAGLEMASICPALNMAKVTWGLGVLVTVDLPVGMCLNSQFLLSGNCLFAYSWEEAPFISPQTSEEQVPLTQKGNCCKSCEFVQYLFTFKTSGTCCTWISGKTVFTWSVGKENPVVGQETSASARRPLGLLYEVSCNVKVLQSLMTHTKNNVLRWLWNIPNSQKAWVTGKH